MRALLHRLKMTRAASTSLLSLLSLLTWLGWRSQRGSPLHTMRLWVLAALVALAGGVAAGCGDDNAPNPNTGTDNPTQPEPMCYETVPTCYAPMETPPPDNNNGDTQDGGVQPPPPMPTCYQPTPMCYASMEVPEPTGGEVGSGGPQPAGEVPQSDADVQQPPPPRQPPPPQRMCYAPRPATDLDI